MELYCFNKYTVIVFILLCTLLIGLLAYSIYRSQLLVQHFKPARSCPACPTNQPSPLPIGPQEIVDEIRQYDYKKMFDPLEEPRKRIHRHEIPPYAFKRLIDFPTRGFPDNFRQVGILINKDDNADNPNKIIRLMGRQEYPGSNRYEYHTAISSGNEIIKIPIRNRRRGQELYDHDDIVIPELDSKYTVSMYDYDEPKYYPAI